METNGVQKGQASFVCVAVGSVNQTLESQEREGEEEEEEEEENDLDICAQGCYSALQFLLECQRHHTRKLQHPF
jgi:hypothetical protein